MNAESEENVIEVEDLVSHYGDRAILKGVSTGIINAFTGQDSCS